MNKAESWFCAKVIKINKPFVRLAKKKREITLSETKDGIQQGFSDLEKIKKL